MVALLAVPVVLVEETETMAADGGSGGGCGA